jgi:hypothetical protein
VLYLVTACTRPVIPFLLTSAILLRLTGNDAIDQWSFGLDELLHSPLHLQHHHLLHWSLHIDRLDLRLWSNPLDWLEIREEVTSLHDDFLIVFEELYVGLQFLDLLLLSSVSALGLLQLVL